MAKVRNLADEISAEDLDKIKASTDGAYPVDAEWMILAEWLRIAGYQAYLDARNDAVDGDGNLIINMNEVVTLIEATRKLEYAKHYENAEASFIGSVSSQTKNPVSTFRKLSRKILNKAKV